MTRLFFFLKGKYITLSLLKEMKNGDMVNIVHVVTDLMDISIPSDVIQDGAKANLDKFVTRIYFQRPLQVKVTYFSNFNGEQRFITLQNLKAVSIENVFFLEGQKVLVVVSFASDFCQTCNPKIRDVLVSICQSLMIKLCVLVRGFRKGIGGGNGFYTPAHLSQ